MHHIFDARELTGERYPVVDTDLILGLDISTAVTGIAVLRQDGSLLELDFVDTRSETDLWKCADAIRHRISKLALNRTYSHIFVEENLQGFRSGFSSAATISKLAKINGITTYMARTALNVEPTYIMASSARAKCGIKIIRASSPAEKKDPRWAKHQVWTHMTANHPDVAAYNWPKTKQTRKNPVGRLRDECYDMIDAYVVAMAGWKLVNSGT